MIGCGEAEVVISAPADTIWHAVVHRRGTRAWWGELDHDIDHVAGELTVTTGSASFYRLWVEDLVAPCRLLLTSSYLGVAAPTTVSITLVERADGVVVRITETLPEDDPAAVGLATDLWRHRLGDLRRAVTDADDPPDELRQRCRLDDPRWRPLHPANLVRWLPVSGGGTLPRRFYVVDADGARPFLVTEWRPHYDERIDLRIAVAPSGPATAASVAVVESGGALHLSVHQAGWADLALDHELRQVLRSRFARTWRQALDTARRLSEEQ